MAGKRPTRNLDDLGGGFGSGSGGFENSGNSAKSPFNHVSEPPFHEKKDGWFVTDKPTSDSTYPGHRFMSTNLGGDKLTYIYSHTKGCCSDKKER